MGTDILGLSRDELVLELAAFYRLSRELVSVSTADGRFRRVNDAWAEVLGVPASEIVGRKWLDFVHPDDVVKTVEAARSMSSSDLTEFVNRYRRGDGTWVTLSWRATAWSGGLTFSITNVVP